MARFNEILTGRYNRYLQKLLQMKGGSPAPQLAGEIQASIVLFHGVETRVHEGWDRFAMAFNQPGVAAQTSQARIRNPVGSNTIIVLEKITVANALADAPTVSGGPTVTDLATIVSNVANRLDPRGRPGSTAIVSRAAAASAVLNQVRWSGNGPANFTLDLMTFEDHEWPLLPAEGVQIEAGTVNQNLTFSILWRERALEGSEVF